MNRTRYLISLLGLCTALVVPMHGQVTRAAFNTAADLLLEDDGPAEEITPEAIGTLIKSLAASSHLALTDGTVVVTSGSYADPTWLTGLAWSKIGTTPTTLSGYGITDAQGLDTDLTTWASLTPSANAQSLVTAANYAAMRALLDLEVGTDFYGIAAADAAFDAAGSAATAQATVQADVDQNETDADAAIAAVQSDVDQNESDADTAIANVQSDVDQNETDADNAIAAVQNDVDQNETDADNAIALKQDADADLTDLAEDGSLSGSKVGPGINAANITTGALPPDRAGTGSGLQILRRNAANTALEFATVNAVGGGDLNVEDIDTFAELSGIVADGTFTNSDAPVVFTDATPSTNTTTGAFRVAGGFGIEGNINAGGNISGVDGTFSGDVTAPNLASQLAARSPDSGIVFTGVIAAVGNATSAISTFTVGHFRWSGVLLEGTDSSFNPLSGLGDNKYFTSGTKYLGLAYTPTSRTVRVIISDSGGTLLKSYSIAADQLGVFHRWDAVIGSGSAELYMDGVAVSTSESGSGLAWGDAITGLTFFDQGTRTSSKGVNWVTAQVSYGNVALTAAEVLTLHRFGWAALPKYVHAVGAGGLLNTSAAENAYSTSWDTFSSTATTLTASDATESKSNIRVRFPAAIPQGKAFRLKFTPTFTGLSSMTMLGDAGAYAGASFDQTAPTLTSGVAVDVVLTKSSAALTGLIFLSNTSSDNVAHEFSIADFSVELIGVAGSWDFSTGVGLKQQDESGAGNTMTLSATGVQRLRANDIQTIKSPNGTVYKLEVANDGTLSATAL